MFSSKLKELRESKGLSQKQLAEIAGLSQRAVSHWEQGLRSPSWDAVLALADALGVSCEVFRPGRATAGEEVSDGGSGGRATTVEGE